MAGSNMAPTKAMRRIFFMECGDLVVWKDCGSGGTLGLPPIPYNACRRPDVTAGYPDDTHWGAIETTPGSPIGR
jgi:hypothetical protein